ncbi:NAD(P)H-dependent oxidoreductase [Vallitalea okinawensis]|uniref:NAD(P)H-dependent oxidoreductase n=1 Tax=Vallitalea okinawensis TaxID=2078660 RepID=UPI000CFB39F4|nr:NAD(P)H-dependent oxidoreductase [Vallitalea okinawensis]
MNVLVISDEANKKRLGHEIEVRVLNYFQKETMNLTHLSVKKDDLNYCVGCFGCWVKTPGLCVFDDFGRRLNKHFVESDYVIILTPVVYGCYSTAIKRVLDRTVPNILPFFKIINNEVHHAPRYDHYPQLIILGYGEDITESEEKTFRALTQANAINFQLDKAKTFMSRRKEDIDQLMNDFTNDLGRSEKGVAV